MDSNVQRLCVDLGNGGAKGALVRSLGPAVKRSVNTQLAEYAEAKSPAEGRRRVVEAVAIPGDEEHVDLRELVTAFVPSKVGVGSVNMGALSLGGFEKRGRAEKPIQIASDEGTYLVGHNVERYTDLLERFDPSKYADSPELRAVTRAVLAQILTPLPFGSAEVVDGGSQDVAVIAALPVDVMMADTARETIKGVEAWLLGEHRFSYNGKGVCVNVRAVKAMAQPVGAFFSWGLDLAGEWTRDEADLTDASVAVLDSGFNTLDLLLVKQGHIEKRETGGDNLGVRVAAQEIANALKAKYRIVKSLIEVDALIRQYFEKGQVVRIIGGEKRDLTPIVRQALQSLATQTIGFVQSKWGNATEFSYVLLAGGGALALDAPLRRHIPRAERLPDPVQANAIGLAKLAQRRGTFKGL